MKTIFDETNLGGMKVKNRLMRSATGENLATPEGHIPEDLMTIYRELAEGGVGLITLSFTSVAPVDHFDDGLLRLHDDALIPEYKKLVDMIHQYDCRVMPQLALGMYKKQSSFGSYKQIKVDQMDQDDVQEVIRKFVSAAYRAKQAGFDGVQLHGCHGFVLNTFLNPNTNHRKDEYGQTLAGSAKVVLEIIRGIRSFSEDFPISIKMSAGDLRPEEMLEVCKMLGDAGLNCIEYEGYFSEMVPLLQKEVGLPVILTGGHRDLDTLDALLNQYGVEYFGMSRPLIREPDLPNRWKNGVLREADCVSCGMCMSTYGYRCAQIPSKFNKPPRRNR